MASRLIPGSDNDLILLGIVAIYCALLWWGMSGVRGSKWGFWLAALFWIGPPIAGLGFLAWYEWLR